MSTARREIAKSSIRSPLHRARTERKNRHSSTGFGAHLTACVTGYMS
jgi:hypothetical protein